MNLMSNEQVLAPVKDAVVQPISKAHLLTLKPGDKFHTEGLFVGLSDKSISWTVIEVGKCYQLRARYFGVFLGDFEARINGKGKVVVSVAKK